MTKEFIQKNRYKFFTIGAIGTFMGTLDGSILNVALPTIAGELDCSIDTVAWVILAYSLTLVSLMMVFGAWTERKGYAFAYKFGYTLFITGSILCVFAQSIGTLVVARVIQAVGAAMFQAIGTSMVTTVFPPEERGKGIGMMVMVVSAGLMTGPPLGGFILDIWPWQSIFAINIPIGLFGLFLAFMYFRDFPKPDGHRKMKLAGAVALAIGLAAGMFGLSLLDKYPISDPRILSLWGVAAAALLAFFYFEGKPEKALIGLDILKNRQFTTALTAMLLMFMAMAGSLILIPFYLQNLLGMPPRTVGLFLILLPVLMFILAPLSGRVSDKIGYRWLTAGGMATLAAGLYMVSGLNEASTTLQIILALIVVGVGIGIFSTPNTSALMGSVTESQRAVTSGIISTNRNIGMAMGIAISTALFAFYENRFADLTDKDTVFVASFERVVTIFIVLALLGAVVSLTRKNRLD